MMFVTLISLLSAVRVLSSTPAPPQKKTDETQLLRGSPRKLTQVQCGNKKLNRKKDSCHECMNSGLDPDEKRTARCNGNHTSDCMWDTTQGKCVDKPKQSA